MSTWWWNNWESRVHKNRIFEEQMAPKTLPVAFCSVQFENVPSQSLTGHLMNASWRLKSVKEPNCQLIRIYGANDLLTFSDSKRIWDKGIWKQQRVCCRLPSSRTVTIAVSWVVDAVLYYIFYFKSVEDVVENIDVTFFFLFCFLWWFGYFCLGRDVTPLTWLSMKRAHFLLFYLLVCWEWKQVRSPSVFSLSLSWGKQTGTRLEDVGFTHPRR